MGRSGLRVSELALGAMTFSDRGLSWGATPEDARTMFDMFAEAGGTFVDAANIYGDDVGGQEGAAERVLSDLLAADREHFVVATKYTSSNTEDISRSGNSFKSMRQSVDASLRALDTDYIDLLWVHTWDATTPVDEMLRGADQLVTAGKILYFAFSDTPAWVISWSPLAGGVLRGKYRSETRSTETHRLTHAAFDFLEKPGGDTTAPIADVVVDVATELDRPPKSRSPGC